MLKLSSQNEPEKDMILGFEPLYYFNKSIIHVDVDNGR